jgi:hypothetical protein
MTTFTILGSALAVAGVYVLAHPAAASLAARSRRPLAVTAWCGSDRELGTSGFGHGTTMSNPQTKRSARHLGTILT